MIYTSSTGTPVPGQVVDDSEMNSYKEIVWAKSARSVWGMGRCFGDALYFTRDTVC